VIEKRIRVIGIDPGPVESALVEWDGEKVLSARDVNNEEVLQVLEKCDCPIAIERLRGFGLTVGNEVLDTVEWVGRFFQAAKPDCYLIDRKTIVHSLCSTSRAGDKEIRQALIYRIGEQGTKKNPGPLFGVTGHKLPALAVAVVWHDLHSFGTLKAETLFKEGLKRTPIIMSTAV
jgi:hypothetical protein